MAWSVARWRKGVKRLVSGRRWRFPGWTWSLGTALVIATTIALGQWQTHRAELREAQLAQYQRAISSQPLIVSSPDGLVTSIGRRVILEGEWADAGTILLDNRVHKRRAGVWVLTPLRVDRAEPFDVLVLRGWMPFDRARSELPTPRPVSGHVRLDGIAIAPPSARLQLGAGEDHQGRLWNDLDLKLYRARLGLNPPAALLQLDTDIGDGLERDWPLPGTRAQQNRIYAGQWFSFAGLTLILYVVLNFRSNT